MNRGRWVLGFVAASAVLGASSSAQAEFPGANGRIAFTTQVTGRGDTDIATASSIGANPVDLTHSSLAQDSEPRYSANGKRIVYVRSTHTKTQLCVMSSTGDHHHCITQTHSGERSPSFSPGGNRVVFSQPSKAGQTLRIVNSDGAHNHSIGVLGDQPVWSPNGRWITYVAAGEVWKVRPNGDHPVDLTPGFGYDVTPDWSPDGQNIVFTRLLETQTEIDQIAARGGGFRTLLPAGDAYDASYSPTGRRIVFVDVGQGNGDVLTMPLDGGLLQEVTSDPLAQSNPAWQPG